MVAAAALADPARARCTPTTRRGIAAATSATRTRSAPSGSSTIWATRWRVAGRPVRLIGHSMGGLHSWCLAAARPDLVSAAGRRGHGAGLPRPHHRTVGAVAARAAGRVRFGAAGLRRVRAGRRSVLPGGVRPDRDRLAPARPPGRWIEIAAEWGTRDYWRQWQSVRAPALLIEAGRLGHAARADAADGRDRLPGNVSARARRRSPRPRRRAADLPGCGRVVPNDARRWRLSSARTAACSKRVRTASTSCCDAVGVAVVLEQPADHGGGHPELVEAQPQRAGAVRGPAEQRGQRERGEQDQKGQCSSHGSNARADKYPANSGRTDTLAIRYCHGD